MMDLYIFGHKVKKQGSQSKDLSQRPGLRAEDIKILWASWCDLIIHSTFYGGTEIAYHGTSLTHKQADHICALRYGTSPPHLTFFGRHLDHGVKGFISSSSQEVVIFHTDQEIKQGRPEVETIPLDTHKHENCKIVDVQLASNGSVLFSTMGEGRPIVSGMYEFPSFGRFLQYLRPEPEEMTGFGPPQELKLDDWFPLQGATNATAYTALGDTGQVYTHAVDMRYPKCLGRESSDQTSTPQPVPYLSETVVNKIASGGYYTAAITSDGELYIWGQSPPGTGNELAVLKRDAAVNYEDEFVRSVEVRIEGEVALVTDVAIGWGHMFVAAEVRRNEDDALRAVFAAGCNERGQLGLGSESSTFVEELREVQSLKGKRVRQLLCSGWSSYVVVDDPRGQRVRPEEKG
ncbi:RCC1/BLIP-II [Massarina eburnea CBS 473.64]|uniref:RCC1/BLIP-II n=1 Tax=Massarina eburnea CBS 473.64 TaxID=1395130 RepID=A0A6A6RLS9_9PLEO|nr:RCC1/BLIP-II [Massarina eburnea CBS 473.64]